jgi:hypothetical protein
MSEMKVTDVIAEEEDNLKHFVAIAMGIGIIVFIIYFIASKRRSRSQEQSVAMKSNVV